MAQPYSQSGKPETCARESAGLQMGKRTMSKSTEINFGIDDELGKQYSSGWISGFLWGVAYCTLFIGGVAAFLD